MAAEVKKIVEDLVYALEEGRIPFNERDTEFINSMESWRSQQKPFTPRQARTAEVIWDKRLKGREGFTKWDEDRSILFDGKLYQEVLGKLEELYDALVDGHVFTEWEEHFISDLYEEYFAPMATGGNPDEFNKVLTDSQIEHLEKIYEKEFG